MEKKPFTVTITDNKSGETTTMDLTGIVMYGIENGDEEALKASRVLMGISPRELAAICYELENSEEVQLAKLLAGILAKNKGKECKCEKCTKKREEEAAKKEEVK